MDQKKVTGRRICSGGPSSCPAMPPKPRVCMRGHTRVDVLFFLFLLTDQRAGTEPRPSHVSNDARAPPGSQERSPRHTLLCPVWVQTAGNHTYGFQNPAEVSPSWAASDGLGTATAQPHGHKSSGELGPQPLTCLPTGARGRLHVKMGMVWSRLQEGPRAWPDPLSCCDLGTHQLAVQKLPHP